jgi:excinuclease UvrABC nuclease subunit
MISCWEYQLNLCSRTCVQKKDGTTNLVRFINNLTSSDSTIVNNWTEELNSYINKLQYEKAKKTYLSLSALKTIQQRFAGIGQLYEKSHFEFTNTESHKQQIYVTVYSYRKGKLINEKSQILNRRENFSAEVLILYFLQDYFQKNTIIPKRVSLNTQLPIKTQTRFKNWMRRYFQQPVILEVKEK